MQKHLQEIRRSLLPHRDKKRARFLVGYMNTKLTILGLDMPTVRQIAAEGYSFSRLPERQIDKIWQEIFGSAKEFEVLTLALIYYQQRREALDLHHWKFLKTWVRRVDNWAHSDQLSDVLATLHERYPKTVYPVYIQWNKSKNPWAVRQSLVGLFYYAQARPKQPAFSQALRLVKGAFYHPDVYVQKGVGWTLREMYNVYPERTYAFLQNVAAELSPTAWQAATEKLSKQQKQFLLLARKKQI